MADDLHVYVHLDPLTVALVPARRPGQPVTVITTLGGKTMPGELTVDQTGDIRNVWIDDKGDTDAPRPDGAQVTRALSDPTFGTIVQDPNDPDHATLQPAREGQVNLTTTITDAAGNPLMEPDGVTPFSVPDYALTIRPGAAVGAETEFAVEAAPAPTPPPAPAP